MKRFVSVFAIFFYCSFLQAQEMTVLNVVYDFCYKRDLKDTSNPYRSEMVLSIGQQASRYVTRTWFDRNSPAAIKQKKLQEERAAGAGGGATAVAAGGPMLSIGKAGTLIDEEIFIDKAKSNIQTAGRIGFRSYHFSVNLPTINWKLSSDIKEICGYKVQKAVGDFAGRTFEVWFAPDLPYSFGPWKLLGLPGLILSARDSKNEVSFICKEILKNEDPEELVKSFMNLGRSVEVKPKEYQRMAGLFASDPAAIVEAQIPGTPLHIRNIDSPGDNSVRKLGKYNPIELK